jgi:hypothetical protein
MKIKYKSLILGLGAVLALSSCDKNDPMGDVMTAGQEVPTTYWEVGSTVCKAGDSFTFQGKYTAPEGKDISYSQIWYRVNREETAAATVKLAGSALSYTKTVSSSDNMRAYQPIVTYQHSAAEWDGYEYVIRGEVPVSRTLSPVTWADAKSWDESKFSQYYPAGFDEEFKSEVIEYLTKDSTYYSSLRTVYINYAFTNEQFKAINEKYGLNFPANIDMSTGDNGTAEKSDLWYSTSTASDDAIIGYYYTTVDANGNTIVHEVAKDAQQQDGVSYYPVYKSCAWVFCRYNDDLGAIISTVRPEYLEAFKELLKVITFQEWIFDSTDNVYKVDFSRKYTLSTQFRVYDNSGEEGIAADVREISIN